MSNKIRKSILDYQFEGNNYAGQMLFNESADRAPGLFIVHTWLGIDQSIQKRAVKFAELGYAVFIVDLFGPGNLPSPPHESMAAILPYVENRKRFRSALQTGLAAFKSSPLVKDSKIAALGYCFGGCGVLEMARAGMEMSGVVSLHGELNTTMPAKKGEIKSRLLVLHGDADPIVKPETVADFFSEMQAAEANWEFTSYGRAKHSFTGEGTSGTNTPEAGLDEYAEKRSWYSVTSFLDDVLR